MEKLSVCSVELDLIPMPENGELSNEIYLKCCFCEKYCKTFNNFYQFYVNKKLSGQNKYFCSFCLRHNFNNKKNKDILILSFRGIIGYFYFQKYLHSQEMWIEEIKDYINCHVEAGLTNPVFSYDPDTFLWFIDFSKVGKSKKKIPLEEVLKTIVNILTCFNLYDTMPSVDFYKKYEVAIRIFYDRRYRPNKRKILTPTTANVAEKEIAFDKIRNFIFKDLQYKK